MRPSTHTIRKSPACQLFVNRLISEVVNNLYHALSHPVRRQILRLLNDGPMPAGEIAGHFDVSKPTMSGHFNVLKDAGLVDAERDGTTIRYRLNISVLEEAAAAILDLMGAGKESKGADR